SKIDRLQKSRESRFLDFSSAARLRTARTKVRSRFCDKPCGPSRRRSRNASVVLGNFVRHPKKTFATQSALFGHGAMSDLSPLCAPKRTFANVSGLGSAPRIGAMSFRNGGACWCCGYFRIWHETDLVRFPT